jgi:hypothetical protein
MISSRDAYRIFWIVVIVGILAIALPAIVASRVGRSAYHDFVISGTVVDDSGRPIDGFKIQLITSRSRNFGTDSGTQYQYVDVASSEFHIERSDYSGIRLGFMKQGYAYQYLDFSTGGVYTNQRIVLQRDKSPGSTTGAAR